MAGILHDLGKLDPGVNLLRSGFVREFRHAGVDHLALPFRIHLGSLRDLVVKALDYETALITGDLGHVA
jgi:hypothetical protein